MHPLDDDPHETTDPAPDLASLRPLRLFQTVTAVTGALSAAGVGGVLALQSTPGYARAVLEARSWGASEVTDADVAAFLTPAGAWPVAAAFDSTVSMNAPGPASCAKAAASRPTPP